MHMLKIWKMIVLFGGSKTFVCCKGLSECITIEWKVRTAEKSELKQNPLLCGSATKLMLESLLVHKIVHSKYNNLFWFLQPTSNE